jgi:hypothetical protein
MDARVKPAHDEGVGSIRAEHALGNTKTIIVGDADTRASDQQ